MGGTLAVTIRDPQGQWHKMARWTNPTPYTFTSSDFLNGGKMLTEYLQTWHEMCSDFDAWAAKGSPKEIDIGMAEVYCSPTGSRDMIAPDEYGLVYIDFIKKHFWHCQGYTDYEKIFGAKFELEQRSRDPEGIKWVNDVAPRIVSYERYLGSGQAWELKEVSFNSGDELMDFVNAMTALSRLEFAHYNLDPGEWQYHRFAESHEGAMEFVKSLQGEGIELTDKELEIWNAFRNEGY